MPSIHGKPHNQIGAWVQQEQRKKREMEARCQAQLYRQRQRQTYYQDEYYYDEEPALVRFIKWLFS